MAQIKLVRRERTAPEFLGDAEQRVAAGHGVRAAGRRGGLREGFGRRGRGPPGGQDRPGGGERRGLLGQIRRHLPLRDTQQGPAVRRGQRRYSSPCLWPRIPAACALNHAIH